jgi:hypothetical protein
VLLLPSRASGGADELLRAINERIELLRQREVPAWRQTPWLTSLVQARKISQQEGRPIFLFSIAGDMFSNRC